LNHARHLQKCILFNDLEDSFLVELESRMRWQRLQSGEMLCHKGDAPAGL
jgi:hypothetical protein